MNLTGSRNQLMAVTKQLSVQWQQTQNHWRDAKAQEFDLRYIESLQTHVTAAFAAIEKLDRVIAKVRSDCE